MSRDQSAESDAPILCAWCNETSEGNTYLAFIHAHADCPFPYTVADMARAWREGAITALDYATRNEDGITLSLDLEAHPNPYETRPIPPGKSDAPTSPWRVATFPPKGTPSRTTGLTSSCATSSRRSCNEH